MKTYRWSLAAVLLPAVLAGCQQETRTGVTQVPEQSQVNPTQTRQYEKTAGPVIYINTRNADFPTTRPAELTQGAVTKLAEGVAAVTTPGGMSQADGRQVVIQYNTINIGNQEPAITGTTTGTATAGQTPSQTSNVYPTQTVTPEFTSAVPITFGMPGSAVSGAANAAGSGGTLSNPSANPTQTPTYTTMSVPAQYAGQIATLIMDFLGKIKGTAAPAASQAAP